MLLTHFEYHLPPELIAQDPAPQRDAARLLVLDRASGHIAHRMVSDLPEYLRAGDVLVVNDTRVIPARLFGVYDDGRSVEVLLVRPVADRCWEVLVKPARPARAGRRMSLACGHLDVTVITLGLHGRRIVQLPADVELRRILHSYGVVPLPPYIRRPSTGRERCPESGRDPGDPESTFAERGATPDRERYQTVYAREEGAVAAPTAGLHFTAELLDRIRDAGVHVCPVTLHVGPGTFLPVRVDCLSQHRMESERYAIPAATAEAVSAARQAGRRVVAVGTTCVRTLEHAALNRRTIPAGSGDADLFITPGFRFRVVDVFLTNFHLPKSTPLVLVASFAGLDATLRAYREAIAQRYRFYSYGDAMLIL